MSTIVLTNENALRVENDDRRTVFLDVSPSRKGDLEYFKKLGNAMKYPGVGEAFYAYLRAIADAHPDFNGNPPPMTASKQDHIISTLPPLFQFIKDTYLVVKNHITDLPVQEFYRIHEIDEIDIEGIDIETPEKPASDPKALEKFLANIYSIPANNPQDVQEKPAEEKPAPIEEKPTEEQSIPKKAPPPVPPKPDSLKVKPAPVIKEDSVPEEPPAPVEEPDQEDTPPTEEPAPEADDDYDVLDDLLSDPTPEQQPESPAESSASVAKSDPEPASEEHRWDRKPWVKNSKDQVFNDLYNTGKDLWAKYQDASDEYDWEILAFEVEECPTYIEDEYQYYLREVVDRFKDWVEYNGDSPKAPSRKEFADLIRVYKEDRNAEIIPTPSGHKTMRLDKGKVREIPEELPKTNMEREWEAANGYVDWDEEDLDRTYSKIDSI
ncbi:unnamed protein product [Rhizophagus irregularis]|nr:unnamed protein product [Rhizophagus irregularis]